MRGRWRRSDRPLEGDTHPKWGETARPRTPWTPPRQRPTLMLLLTIDESRECHEQHAHRGEVGNHSPILPCPTISPGGVYSWAEFSDTRGASDHQVCSNYRVVTAEFGLGRVGAPPEDGTDRASGALDSGLRRQEDQYGRRATATLMRPVSRYRMPNVTVRIRRSIGDRSGSGKRRHA
jgi:hypothetical protein